MEGPHRKATRTQAPRPPCCEAAQTTRPQADEGHEKKKKTSPHNNSSNRRSVNNLLQYFDQWEISMFEEKKSYNRRNKTNTPRTPSLQPVSDEHLIPTPINQPQSPTLCGSLQLTKKSIFFLLVFLKYFF